MFMSARLPHTHLGHRGMSACLESNKIIHMKTLMNLKGLTKVKRYQKPRMQVELVFQPFLFICVWKLGNKAVVFSGHQYKQRMLTHQISPLLTQGYYFL